jgi:ABC-type sulfate/molybdate transport systems ATPase subunit
VQRKLISVVVTHDMRLAEDLADQVIFLDQGRVVVLGIVPKSRIPSSDCEGVLGAGSNRLAVATRTGSRGLTTAEYSRSKKLTRASADSHGSVGRNVYLYVRLKL